MVSAVLLGLYAQGGLAWPLGFFALVPWLRSLDKQRSFAGVLLGAWLMSVAFTASVFAWFGIALGDYTGLGPGLGLAALLVLAPLFQPQIMVFALVRHASRGRLGAAWGALAGASAWVAVEWLIPKVLGDTLGHGLYPSRLLRQAADLGGALGLSLLLLLCNEGLALAWARRRDGLRAAAWPLGWAALVPLLLALYGVVRLPVVMPATPPSDSSPLRLGLVQSNLVDYEGRRQTQGTAAVVREILDTHYAMSYDAVERQHVDAVLWSETVYPTTFGHPKSAAGAELDQEILATLQAAGVPFVFGTYDQDAAGEYNAAAFVAPARGLLGMYRKTRLFPLTEYVPGWLDSPWLRTALPWTGHWRAGDGARVFPLLLADGREIPVLPLICLDDVDTGLAIDGARLGAIAILTLSNDAWFTSQPQGAALHQAVAAFRSIETRLPQFRVTTNGFSAVIDPTGSVTASAPIGSRTLVIGSQTVVPNPPATLVVQWGNWVGAAACIFLLLLAGIAGLARLDFLRQGKADELLQFPVSVRVLPHGARWVAGLLRGVARGSLLVMGAALLQDDALRANPLAQMRLFTLVFVAPEMAAWFLLRAFSASAVLEGLGEGGKLLLSRGAHRLELALHDLVAVELWRLPLPGPGLNVRLASGALWPYGLVLNQTAALARALLPDTRDTASPIAQSRWDAFAQARAALARNRLDAPVCKFVLLPLVMAGVAFRLHQNIAYGSSLGEYYTFGLQAYVSAFALWWATWTMGILMTAAAIRAMLEIASLGVALLLPARASLSRHWLEHAGRVALFVGVPGWLVLQVVQF